MIKLTHIKYMPVLLAVLSFGAAYCTTTFRNSRKGKSILLTVVLPTTKESVQDFELRSGEIRTFSNPIVRFSIADKMQKDQGDDFYIGTPSSQTLAQANPKHKVHIITQGSDYNRLTSALSSQIIQINGAGPFDFGRYFRVRLDAKDLSDY